MAELTRLARAVLLPGMLLSGGLAWGQAPANVPGDARTPEILAAMKASGFPLTIPHWTADPAAAPDPTILAAIASKDRLSSDRETDASRHYSELMEFLGIRAGMRLLDFFGAHGISTEVMARIVGPQGHVYLQNPPWYYKRFTRARVDAHLAGNRLPNVSLVDSPFLHMPLPANSVDGVLVNMVWHDVFWMQPDDASAILNELARIIKPGGFIGIADHAAPEGANVSMSCLGCKHRVEERTVRRMFLQAGFQLDGESDALRNAKDDRTQTAFESPIFHGNTDRFLLRFRKPR